MPKLSLYKPEKGNNYRFIDHHISQMFQVGGTDVYVHKYLGPKIQDEGTADQPVYDAVKETNIQDLLFLENRDRKYDPEIYRIRGIYNVQNIDFNLSQFGLFIDNDTIFMTVHINDFIKFLGRKPLCGDVMEMPHLRDDFALNDFDVSLPRYYVIEDVGRASEGFSATWFPHLYRLKIKKITDSQQFADVLTKPVGEDADVFVGDYDAATTYQPGEIVRRNGVLFNVTASTTNNEPSNSQYFAPFIGNTLENILSTRAIEYQINDAVIAQSENDAPLSGYETRQFYTLSADPNDGSVILNRADTYEIDASFEGDNILASSNNAVPLRTGYTGYLVGDGYPVNGYVFGHGIQFPTNPAKDDFYLRNDFLPNRLFRFDGTKWLRTEDAVRMPMTQTDTRQTLKTSFVNNIDYTYQHAIATEYATLEVGDFAIDTQINFVNVNYLILTLHSAEVIPYQLPFTVADYPGIITAYTVDAVEKVRITLPEGHDIPYYGTWKIELCDSRELQRQSLSKALKPRADL